MNPDSGQKARQCVNDWGILLNPGIITNQWGDTQEDEYDSDDDVISPEEMKFRIQALAGRWDPEWLQSDYLDEYDEEYYSETIEDDGTYNDEYVAFQNDIASWKNVLAEILEKVLKVE